MHLRRSLTRHIATLLVHAMFWHPVVVLANGPVNGISVAPGSGNTRLDQASNGVPVVNIATPNASGLSHNTFTDYNVDQRGLILNNATARQQSTQLGGIIIGNSNLRDQAAQTILNEVNGGSPSRLQGFTEVAGQSARVIVTNPWGISCNGCGFINTPEVTLSTGRPVIEGGNLDHYAVDQGRVTIEGLGLNAGEVSRFEIITRAAEINADIHADQLDIVTGANNVDAESLATTSRQGSGTRPTLAIDSSALGGMYANRIRLVGTEAGVGVRLAGDMAANGGDLIIDTHGQLRISGNASSTGAVRLTAAGAELSGGVHGHQAVAVDAVQNLTLRDGQLTSAGDIALRAGQTLHNEGGVIAGIENDQRQPGGDITLNATTLTNLGVMDATQRLEATATTATQRGQWLASEIDVQAHEQLTNQGSISGSEVSIAAATLINQTPTGQQQAATLRANKLLSLDTDRLTNSGTLQYGQGQAVRFDGEHIDNTGGTLQFSGGDISGRLASLDNRDGQLVADRLDIAISGDLSNQRGLISAELGDLSFDVGDTLNNASGVMQSRQGSLALDTATIDNTDNGRLIADRGLRLAADDTLDNRQGGIQSARGNVELKVGSLSNDRGKLLAEQSIAITASRDVDNRAGTLLASTGTLTLNATSVDNRSSGAIIAEQQVRLIADGVVNNSEGGIQSRSGNVVLDVGRLSNGRGKVLADQTLAVTSSGAVDNADGALQSRQASMTLIADGLSNVHGILSADQSLDITDRGETDNTDGNVQASQGNLALTTDQLTNTGGTWLAGQSLEIAAQGSVSNHRGIFQATEGRLALDAATLDNSQGTLVAGQSLTVSTDADLTNTGGVVEAQGGDLTLSAARLVNQRGNLVAAQDIEVTASRDVDNRSGVMHARGGDLTLTAGSLDNRAGTLGAAKTADLTLTANPDHTLDGSLDNGLLESQGEAQGDEQTGLISADRIDIKAERLANDGGRLVARLVDLGLNRLSNADGLISADERISLDIAALLDNTDGRLQVVDGELLITQAERIDNTRGVMVGTRLAINTDQVANAVGGITNQDGQLIGDSLTVNAASLNNTGNGLVSAKDGDIQLALDESLTNRSDLQASGNITLSAEVIDNRQGRMLGSGFGLTATQLLNQQGALLGEAGGGSITLVPSLMSSDVSERVPTLNNAHGVIDVLSAALAIDAEPASINNQSGSITAGRLTISADSLDNRLAEGSTVRGQLVSVADGAGDDLILDITHDLDNRGGVIAAQGDRQDGRDLKASFATLNNQGGSLQADSLSLTGATLDNRQGGEVAALAGDARLVLTQTLDNRQGRIIATGLLDIDPPLIDNRGGELAGKTVNLVAGHLDNRKGVVESQGKLDIAADRLTNDDGELQSLGGTDSTITVANTLSNQAGRIKLGSSDATLDAGRIDNRGIDGQSGEIIHAGSGLLTLITDYLDNRSGILQGEGNATSALKDWTSLGQWGFNGALTLDLDKALTLTADDKLTTPGALSLLLPSLNNAGEIRSNGKLVITASSGADSNANHQTNNIANSGVISTLGDLEISAHHLTQQDGRLASGGTATYTLSGNLDNLGYLTSVGDLSIDAANLINRGTLGSQNHLDITSAGCIQNGQEDCNPSNSEASPDNYISALMFAGGNATLYAAELMNSYSDIYTRGELLFARNDQKEFADSLQNRSGTIEAEGDIGIHARAVRNTRDVFNTARVLTGQAVSSSRITVTGSHSEDRHEGSDGTGGSRSRSLSFSLRNGKVSRVTISDGVQFGYTEYQHTETHETRVVDDSPSAQLIAGRDLRIQAHDVVNAHSVMAANRDLTIEAESFDNRGFQGRDISRVTTYTDQQERDCVLSGNFRRCAGNTEATSFHVKTISEDTQFSGWNAANGRDQNGELLPLPFDTMGRDRLPPVETSLPADRRASAIVSAGGKVTIEVGKAINNGEIRDNAELNQLNGSVKASSPDQPIRDVTVVLDRRTSGATAVGTAERMERQRRSGASAAVNDAVAPVVSVSAQTHDTSLDTNGDVGASAVEAPTSGVPPVRDNVPFARVSAIESPAFLLPKGDYGLFVQSTSPQSRYLIETNPAFTELDQWYGSEYLLDKLGHDDDSVYRLLGDGRYETRLIRDAVLATTGQRFLDASLDDDYAQYRYLMDNAVAAREALKLSVGVSLTGEQVAALTHDIVWLEEQEVDGQKVLAPVLYLAQLDERNIRGGAVIQGRDIELIAGGDLVNVGTIRATDSLSATSGGSILQGGRVEAGGSVDLTARNDIRNALSGEIRGEDVRLTATEGDIVNDRLAVVGGGRYAHHTYLDEGGLIEARNDLELRAGRDIVNRAEILAGDDLQASAGRDVVIEGVRDAARTNDGRRDRQSIEQLGARLTAGNDLALDAGRDVKVIASEVQAGGDLAAAARRDIDITSAANTSRQRDGRYNQHDGEQVGAGLTAGNSLALDAGQDVRIIASEVEASGRLAVAAGRDIDIASATNESGERYGRSHRQSIEQVGATLSGEGVALAAGQDVRVVASRLEAADDLSIDAGRDITLLSAADSNHYERRTSRRHIIDRQVRQQGSELVAGDDVALTADNTLALSASSVDAGDDAYLYGGNAVALLAANDQDYRLRESKSTGALFRKKSRRDEVNQLTAIGSEINSDGDLTVLSGGDQRYQGARLTSGEDIRLISGGGITFAAASDIRTESHGKSKSNALWQSAGGKGQTVETLRQSQITAQGELLIQAAKGIDIQIEEVNQQTVSQTIDAMVAADPSLAWLKDMEARGDIDWQTVKALHDSWDYSHSGLSGVAQIVVVIVVAYFTAGAASGLVATAAGSAGASTAAGATWAAATTTTAAGWANVAAATAITGAASNAAVSTINNQGNLSAVWQDVSSSDAVRGYAVAGITAGLTNGLYDGWTSTETGLPSALPNGAPVSTASGLSTAQGIGQFAGNQLLQNGTSALLDRALGGDAELDDALQTSLVNTFAAAGFNAIGDFSQGNPNLENGSLGKAGLHAVMGGLAAEAAGGDFKTGALAAGLNELLVDKLADQYSSMAPDEKNALLVMNSQLIGALAAASTNGVNDSEGLQIGAQVAGSATQYNRLLHDSEKDWIGREAEGDPGKEFLLSAAACVEIHCSAQFPVGSEQYVYYQKLEALGNSPELADELSQIRQSDDFDYGNWDGVSDSAKRLEATYQLGTRAMGALQAVGGTALATSGAALAGTGAGAIAGAALVVVGADQAAAGTATMVNGNPASTFGAQALASQLGISVEQAELWYGLAAMGGELGVVNAVSKGAYTGSVVAVPSGASQATNTGANRANNGIRLSQQLAAEEIAGGHGFQKHVIEQGEFAGLGVTTRQQYQNHIENVLNNPSSVRYTSDGRSFYLQESTGTVVVRNPNVSDGGTAFQPKNWNEYISQLPTRTEPY